MSNEDPVTIWLEELKDGEDSAAQKIWNHFAVRLYVAARKKLRPDSRRVYDEEDVAQSAFHSFCKGIAAGRFPDLDDRDNLWRLLMVITSRKVSQRHRFDQQQCRDVRRTDTDNSFLNVASVKGGGESLEQLHTCELPPEFAAEFSDLCGHMFERLEDPQLQRIGWLKIEGCNDAEIADQLNCSRRTVKRKVERIRRTWMESYE